MHMSRLVVGLAATVGVVVSPSLSGDVQLEVADTPYSLLKEAPAPGQPFRREAILTPTMLAVMARALTPANPSDGLSQLLSAAADGRFADLVREAPVTPSERPTTQVLRGLGLYAVGDAPRTVVAAHLQQALAQGATPSPTLLLLGATHALGGDDRAAVGAWNQARDSGVDDASVATLLVDAYVRQGDVARATAIARAALDAQPGNAAAARDLAAARIAAGHYADALAGLDGIAAAREPETDFLVLHALYAGFVGDTAPGNTPAGRSRLQAVGARYVGAGGRHAGLVKKWLAVVGARSTTPDR